MVVWWTSPVLNFEVFVLSTFNIHSYMVHCFWDTLLGVDGSGSEFFDSGQPPLGLENFSIKIPNFSIFFLQVKKNIIGSGQKISGSGQKISGSKTGWPLIYYRSKVCLGLVLLRRKKYQYWQGLMGFFWFYILDPKSGKYAYI